MLRLESLEVEIRMADLYAGLPNTAAAASGPPAQR